MTGAATRPAFDITKGTREVLWLSEADVEETLGLSDLLDGLRTGFRLLQEGVIQSPHRPELTVPDKGFSLAMPGWGPGYQMAVKVVNVFDANLEINLPNHLALITLYAPETGAATCVMDGTYITGIRTAASAVLSADLLARPDAKVATVIGAGVQGREHLRLLPLIRSFDRINVCSLRHEDAELLAGRIGGAAVAVADVEAAVRESDVVCLASHSETPVIEPDWVKAGTHVSSVGYFPPAGELPRVMAEKHRLFVESLDAFDVPPIGCAELNGLEPASATTLGQVVISPELGRRNDDEVTVYKAMGVGMEDLVAANIAYETAAARGIGKVVQW